MQYQLDRRSVLGKVLAVLHAFGPDDGDLSLTELSRRTGVGKGTLHRVVRDMVIAGLLDRSGVEYRLGSHLFELGMNASNERTLISIAIPFMEDLYELTHETVHLGVRDGRDVMYVSKIGGHRQIPAPSRIGGRMPLHSTAIGKALLAHSPGEFLDEYLSQSLERRGPRTLTAPVLLRKQLAKVAEFGVAFEYEESAVGITCVAAPITGSEDIEVAAISVTGPPSRFDPHKHSIHVRAAAAGIATTLARRGAIRNLHR